MKCHPAVLGRNETSHSCLYQHFPDGFGYFVRNVSDPLFSARVDYWPVEEWPLAYIFWFELAMEWSNQLNLREVHEFMFYVSDSSFIGAPLSLPPAVGESVVWRSWQWPWDVKVVASNAHSHNIMLNELWVIASSTELRLNDTFTVFRQGQLVLLENIHMSMQLSKAVLSGMVGNRLHCKYFPIGQLEFEYGMVLMGHPCAIYQFNKGDYVSVIGLQEKNNAKHSFAQHVAWNVFVLIDEDEDL